MSRLTASHDGAGRITLRDTDGALVGLCGPKCVACRAAVTVIPGQVLTTATRLGAVWNYEGSDAWALIHRDADVCAEAEAGALAELARLSRAGRPVRRSDVDNLAARIPGAYTVPAIEPGAVLVRHAADAVTRLEVRS